MERKRLPFDYSKLKGRIKEKFGTQKAFAKAIGITEAALSHKLTGVNCFKQDDIYRAISALGITEDLVSEYFFTLEVRKV